MTPFLGGVSELLTGNRNREQREAVCRSEKSEEPRAARPVWPPSGAHAGLNAVRAGDAHKRCGAQRQERKGEADSRAEPAARVASRLQRRGRTEAVFSKHD